MKKREEEGAPQHPHNSKRTRPPFALGEGCTILLIILLYAVVVFCASLVIPSVLPLPEQVRQEKTTLFFKLYPKARDVEWITPDKVIFWHYQGFGEEGRYVYDWRTNTSERLPGVRRFENKEESP